MNDALEKTITECEPSDALIEDNKTKEEDKNVKTEQTYENVESTYENVEQTSEATEKTYENIEQTPVKELQRVCSVSSTPDSVFIDRSDIGSISGYEYFYCFHS